MADRLRSALERAAAPRRGRARPAVTASTPVRVLILNERDPDHPRAGGAETHVHEVFRRIAARGHAVTELVSAFAGGAERGELDGVRFERIAPLPTFYPRAAARCARATRRGEFDVVVECLNKMPFLAPLYAARPVLGLCHHLFGGTAFRQVAWPVAAAVVAVERAIPLAYRRAPRSRCSTPASGVPRRSLRRSRGASRSSSTSDGSRPTSGSTSCSTRSRRSRRGVRP
ncbi:MAG: glycosyltransferase family 4 protein [Deltaproteobacteria bacterium]|nr:MAG: glycosyltransferase family 4 protein [Deltaproteobacteria bacterium]